MMRMPPKFSGMREGNPFRGDSILYILSLSVPASTTLPMTEKEKGDITFFGGFILKDFFKKYSY